jgi:hypothetical protein
MSRKEAYFDPSEAGESLYEEEESSPVLRERSQAEKSEGGCLWNLSWKHLRK